MTTRFDREHNIDRAQRRALAPKTAADKQMHFNWGYQDGRFDTRPGGMRREFIRQGELFCLPDWDKPYCEGYLAAKKEEEIQSC